MAGSSPVQGLVLCLALFVTGCGTSGTYAWGHYEETVYLMTADAGSFDLEAEIETLEKDLEKAREHGQRVPPGFHAQLGYMLYLAGDVENARGNFQAEKELFPQSSVFVDTVLSHIGW